MTSYSTTLRSKLTLSTERLTALKSPVLLTGGALFGLFVTLLALIQFATPDLAGNDGYYHIKIAAVMAHEGLRPAFPWLPLTVLNPDDYVNHHFLYHVMLIPFTLLDLREGAKWASIIIPALTFLSGWWLLREQRVPYAALWAIGFFAVSEAFLFRMSMPRAQAASLLFLLIGLHLTLTRRYRWLIPLSFGYVWLYNAFPLMLVLVGAVVAARWLIEQKLELEPLVYAALGLGLGLLINPYFPDNLLFIYHHLAPKLSDATATSVGREWYPYETWTLVENSGGALLLFVGGMFALGFNKERMDTPTTALLFLTVIFGAMLFKSRRFVEYFPAFVLLFGAMAWGPLFKQWTKTHWVRRELPVLLVILLMIAVSYNIQGAQDSLQDSRPYDRYADASAWLVEHTPQGSLLFQTDWDDFTQLFHHNTHNVYTVGLDPTYLQSHDADLYEVWVDITQGRVDAPSSVIVERFGAEYVLTDHKHDEFIEEAAADPHMAEVYRDDYAVLFHIISAEGGEDRP